MRAYSAQARNPLFDIDMDESPLAPISTPPPSSSRPFSQHLRPGLPLGYLDPEAWLLESRFHKSLKYRPAWLESQPEVPDLRVTYAMSGANDPEAPVLVWINGLGQSDRALSEPVLTPSCKRGSAMTRRCGRFIAGPCTPVFSELIHDHTGTGVVQVVID